MAKLWALVLPSLSISMGAQILPFPLGIAEPSADAAYLGMLTHEIADLKLSDGGFVRTWRVDGTPVGSYAGKVVVLQHGADGFRVTFLGADLNRSEGAFDLPLRQGISAKDPRLSYQATVSRERLQVSWRLERLYAGGAPAGPQTRKSYEISVGGVSLMNLRTGEVFQQPEALEKKIDTGSRFSYKRYDSGWTDEPWSTTNGYAWLSRAASGQNTTIYLETDTGGRRQKVALQTGSEPFAYVTLDGSTVATIGTRPEEARICQFFSVPKGEKIGGGVFPMGVRELMVIGRRAYWLFAGGAELKLRADDLSSGKNVWILSIGAEPAVRQMRRP
jgi:hypothetical protein